MPAGDDDPGARPGHRHLDRLRADLDATDRALLEAAARREAIVRQIAAAKAASGGSRPQFDRDRERAVHARAERLAEAAGLDPATARALMLVLVERSHHLQEDASLTAARADANAARRILLVGGGGRMGRRLGAALAERGHAIDVLERADGRDRAAAVGEADVVVLAVPMDAATTVAREIAPFVRADALLCDVNSLKADVCAAMADGCPGEVLGLHPMFGPTVHALRRQKVVVCPVRPGPRAAWLRTELGRMGLELIEADPETHDRMMAVVQVLVHYSTLVMGEALRRTSVSVEESLRFTSPIYRLELAFVGRLFAQSADLYAEIEMANPHGAEVRRAFRAAADSLDAILDRGDHAAFTEAFRGVTAYFHGFEDEAMALSDFIIDAMVRRP